MSIIMPIPIISVSIISVSIPLTIPITIPVSVSINRQLGSEAQRGIWYYYDVPCLGHYDSGVGRHTGLCRIRYAPFFRPYGDVGRVFKRNVL